MPKTVDYFSFDSGSVASRFQGQDESDKAETDHLR